MDDLWEQSDGFLRLAAPMVRYSKLPFRLTVRNFGCDFAFTPMIIADSFSRSDKASNADFQTAEEDRPLGIQFAASDPEVLWKATERVLGLVDAVDLNCGCPQRWAIKDGIGCALLNDPQLVKEMTATLKRRCNVPVSVKIRIEDDLRKTVDFTQQVASTGVDFVTIHARTPTQRSSLPADWSSAATVIHSLKAGGGNRPRCILNGDIFSVGDVTNAREKTGADGVMAARGLLDNPALFAGADCTPLDCIQFFLQASIDFGTPFHTIHQHCIYMLKNWVFGEARKEFNEIRSAPAMFDWLRYRGMY